MREKTNNVGERDGERAAETNSIVRPIEEAKKCTEQIDSPNIAPLD